MPSPNKKGERGITFEHSCPLSVIIAYFLPLSKRFNGLCKKIDFADIEDNTHSFCVSQGRAFGMSCSNTCYILSFPRSPQFLSHVQNEYSELHRHLRSLLPYLKLKHRLFYFCSGMYLRRSLPSDNRDHFAIVCSDKISRRRSIFFSFINVTSCNRTNKQLPFFQQKPIQYPDIFFGSVWQALCSLNLF